MYEDMCRVQEMDRVFYDAQRQGRISFYMQNGGEEGAQVGSAAALSPEDPVYAQYRELGVLMWRGMTLQSFADQCFSNAGDPAKGRQMPVHYGSAAHNIMTISSPLATQLPQASGTAYAIKQSGEDRVAVCYFGEGAASEGDFHAAMNFSATLGGPCIFFCRNNGFAISTSVTDQYNGDGIAARGPAYGMHTIRVDGGDLFAVYEVTRKARALAAEKKVPVLIEAMTYREGHHSTSDDSTRYREAAEIQDWRSRANPIVRMSKYLTAKGLWDADKDAELLKRLRKDVLKALGSAESKPKPDVEHLFTDVYAGEQPWNLVEQEAQLTAHASKYPDYYKHAEH
ncbi:bckd-1A [Symbiodinium sp. KB8]|nr:bckd-1A [Symbiodinium sp. KB8]